MKKSSAALARVERSVKLPKTEERYIALFFYKVAKHCCCEDVLRGQFEANLIKAFKMEE